jgi:hypothetical protein
MCKMARKIASDCDSEKRIARMLGFSAMDP